MPIPIVASVGARGFTSVVGRTAAQSGTTAVAAGGAASKGTGITAGTVAGYMLGGGGSGGAGSQVKQSAILDSKGKPIVSAAAKGSGGGSIEQMREQDATQNRILQLLETIAENTGGKGAGATKDKPQQTMLESLGATIGGFVGSLKMIVGGLGLFRGFKDAKAAYDSGESMFTVFAEGIKGTVKGILNIPFNVLDNILNVFDIDIPDNMGDLIVDGFVDIVKEFVDYIKNLPNRIMTAITGMVENIGIPEIKILGKSFGPYYPFRGSGEVKQENTQGAESGAAFASASPKENNNKKFTMPQSSNKEGITNDLNEIAPVGDVSSSIKGLPPASELTRGTTSYIKDPVTGEGVTIKKAAKQLTEKQAMDILTGNKFKNRISTINAHIKFAFQDGKEPPSIDSLPFMQQQGLNPKDKEDEEYFRKAMYTVYPKLIADLYASETESGESAYALFSDLKDPTSNRSAKDGGKTDTSALANKLAAPVFSDIEAKSSSRPTRLAPSSGDAVMNSSAAAEAAKSTDSSNVVISAPSSTVNAPKSSNMVMPDNIRNNEPSMSRYIDGLYGANI